ncbi:unnamed protein product, partial [Ascophyllum nodosum]
GKLFKVWHDVVREVSGELRDAKKTAVSKPDNALTGALWIRTDPPHRGRSRHLSRRGVAFQYFESYHEPQAR